MYVLCPLNGHKQLQFRVLYLLFASLFKSTSFSTVTISYGYFLSQNTTTFVVIFIQADDMFRPLH